MTINPDLNIAVTAIEYQTDVYGYVTPPDRDWETKVGIANRNDFTNFGF